MLDALARLAHGRPRTVVAAGIAFFILAGAVGSGVFEAVKPFGFTDPDSESVIVRERFQEATGRSATPSLIAVVEPDSPIDSAEGRRRVERVAREIDADEAVAEVVGFYDTGDPTMVSADGRATYLVAFFEGEADELSSTEIIDRLEAGLAGTEGVTLGGLAVFSTQIGETIESDLRRAELIALPIVFLLSLLVFRSLVAALLPPLVGGLAIVGSLFGLRLIAEATDISVFAINLVTGLGLGLAIDYSLFIVSRYREELARHGPGLRAMQRTLATAGRTVIFSGLTVAAALAALVVFPQRFLYSMGIGGAMVALLSAAVALTVLPAVLALLGHRVNALSPARFRRAAEAEAAGERGHWYRFSRLVMRRPVPIAIAAAALLIALGLPFLNARYVFPDAGVLPDSTSAKQVDEILSERFDPSRTKSLVVQIQAPPSPESVALAGEYAERIETLDHVAEVGPPIAAGEELIRLDVYQDVGAFTDEGQELARELRGLDAPFTAQVAGDSAGLVDQKESLAHHLAIAIPIIAVSTFILLFLMTGSVILPIKALIMNLLTVSAAFGILVLVFQDGRLEGLLDYESLGALDTSQPILLFAIIFGLSTDYGVFLLTRIKEARDGGASDTDAVAIGLERTGRIVTFAALLFCVAIGAFVTSQIVFIKQAGFGTAVGVVIDATIIRALLVPSLMRLLGRWNWWAPAPLRRLHAKLGFSEV